MWNITKCTSIVKIPEKDEIVIFSTFVSSMRSNDRVNFKLIKFKNIKQDRVRLQNLFEH